MLATSLSEIKRCDPQMPDEYWSNLLHYLEKTEADDDILPFEEILAGGGVRVVAWCLRLLPEGYDGTIRLLGTELAYLVYGYTSEEIEDYICNTVDIVFKCARNEVTLSTFEKYRIDAFDKMYKSCMDSKSCSGDGHAYSVAYDLMNDDAHNSVRGIVRSLGNVAYWEKKWTPDCEYPDMDRVNARKEIEKYQYSVFDAWIKSWKECWK